MLGLLPLAAAVLVCAAPADKPAPAAFTVPESAPAVLAPVGGNAPYDFARAVRFGETLTYSARWNGFPIGFIHARVWPHPRELNGRRVAMLEVQIEGNDFLSLFYPVSATLKSYVDLQTGASLLFRRRSTLGKERVDDRVWFQYDRKDALGQPEPLALLEEFNGELIGRSAVRRLPGAVCDSVALAWRLRELPRTPDTVTPAVWFGNRYGSGQVAFRVGGKEKISLPNLGKFRCRWLHPQVAGDFAQAEVAKVEGICVENRTGTVMRAVGTLPIGRISIILTRAKDSALNKK